MAFQHIFAAELIINGLSMQFDPSCLSQGVSVSHTLVSSGVEVDILGETVALWWNKVRETSPASVGCYVFSFLLV